MTAKQITRNSPLAARKITLSGTRQTHNDASLYKPRDIKGNNVTEWLKSFRLPHGEYLCLYLLQLRAENSSRLHQIISWDYEGLEIKHYFFFIHSFQWAYFVFILILVLMMMIVSVCGTTDRRKRTKRLHNFKLMLIWVYICHRRYWKRNFNSVRWIQSTASRDFFLKGLSPTSCPIPFGVNQIRVVHNLLLITVCV